MPRKFTYVGLINDETKVFVFKNGDFKKTVDEGFSEQFRHIEEAARRRHVESGTSESGTPSSENFSGRSG